MSFPHTRPTTFDFPITLPLVLLRKSCSNGETLEKQIITSLHSAKLNSLDLAEAIVKLARIQIPDLESDLVPKILNSVVHKLRKEKIVADLDFIKTSAESDRKIWLEGISFLTPQEKEFLKLLLSLQLHPDTTRLHVLPLLNYPDDLKEAIRQGLDVSKAKEIDRINPELGIDALEALEARRAIAKAVIEDNLTLSQTKAEVARTLERFSLVRQDPRSATSVRLSNLARKIKKITLNPDVEGKISNLLAEIESILAD
jgi:ParB family chromosome partitioning protein